MFDVGYECVIGTEVFILILIYIHASLRVLDLGRGVETSRDN